MMSYLSNYHREYSSYGSYSLLQIERSDVISVLKNSIEYSFVFFKCLGKPSDFKELESSNIMDQNHWGGSQKTSRWTE